MEILVDSSVILDILTEDENWFAWSAETLADCAKSNILAVNPIIYAEVSIGFEKGAQNQVRSECAGYPQRCLPYICLWLPL